MATQRDDRAELVDGLVELSFDLHDLLGRIAADHGLSLTQLRLLGVLRDRQPTMQQLADHLSLEKSSVTGLVDRAESRDLVQRFPSEHDARATHVALTKSGQALARRGERAVTAGIKALAGDLSAAEQQRLSQLLHKMRPTP